MKQNEDRTMKQVCMVFLFIIAFFSLIFSIVSDLHNEPHFYYYIVMSAMCSVGIFLLGDWSNES